MLAAKKKSWADSVEARLRAAETLPEAEKRELYRRFICTMLIHRKRMAREYTEERITAANKLRKLRRALKEAEEADICPEGLLLSLLAAIEALAEWKEEHDSLLEDMGRSLIQMAPLVDAFLSPDDLRGVLGISYTDMRDLQAEHAEMHDAGLFDLILFSHWASPAVADMGDAVLAVVSQAPGFKEKMRDFMTLAGLRSYTVKRDQYGGVVIVEPAPPHLVRVK